VCAERNRAFVFFDAQLLIVAVWIRCKINGYQISSHRGAIFIEDVIAHNFIAVELSDCANDAGTMD
jgi:hypothetical protein